MTFIVCWLVSLRQMLLEMAELKYEICDNSALSTHKTVVINCTIISVQLSYSLIGLEITTSQSKMSSPKWVKSFDGWCHHTVH